MMQRFLTSLALAAVLGLFSACSSFDSRWKAAKTDAKATRWEGKWTSEKHHKSDGSAMGGRLRCILEPQDAGRLAAQFRANWLIFASDYSMTLEPVRPGPVARRGGVREYRGTQTLPAMFGGIYRYEAQIDGDRFTARYTSSYDHGTFALQRVGLFKDCYPLHARD